MWKAHDQEKAPDGQHCAHILGMCEPRKRKGSAPGHLIPQSIAVKNPHGAQLIKHAHVEELTNDEQYSPEPQRPRAATQRPERAMAVYIGPADKYCTLDDFKAVEELLDDIDRCANTRYCQMVAQSAKGLRMSPNPHVG